MRRKCLTIQRTDFKPKLTVSALPVGIFRRDGSGGFSGILSNMVYTLLKIAVALSRIIFLWQHPWNFICLYSFWASSECRDIKYGNPGKLFMWPEWVHGPKIHLWPVIFTVMGTWYFGKFFKVTQWTWIWANSGRWWRTGEPSLSWGHKESDTT